MDDTPGTATGEGAGSALTAAFDRIAVINLASRSDRLAEIGAQLARIGLRLGEGGVVRFEAVRPSDAAPFDSIGAHGCFMSHRGLLAEAEADGVASLLILEDDLDLAANPAEVFGPALAALAHRPWDVFYGGYGRPVPGSEGAPGPLFEVPPATGVSATHCVGFRGEAIAEARAFLDTLLSRPPGDPRGGPMHVDGAYGWYRAAHPHRLTLAAVPPLGHQRASRSDVLASPPWYDRIPLLRPAVALARRAKRHLR